MTGEKLKIARETLITLVEKLKPGSLFNVFRCEPAWSLEIDELSTQFRKDYRS